LHAIDAFQNVVAVLGSSGEIRMWDWRSMGKPAFVADIPVQRGSLEKGRMMLDVGGAGLIVGRATDLVSFRLG
jgi:hypothetical protein